MARQLKLPMGTVVPRGLDPEVEKEFRVVNVNLKLMRASKTYAQVKAQAPLWDEATVDEYVLGLIARGVA